MVNEMLPGKPSDNAPGKSGGKAGGRGRPGFFAAFKKPRIEAAVDGASDCALPSSPCLWMLMPPCRAFRGWRAAAAGAGR